ncbi:carbohydrate kinase family protein [Micromonospora sp. SL1-18]|uniref:carbohydrate kinase family protein n=1 Tax=Micromonospora sp. SL1-18 TaxID=3399128 RepID=UPI003A4D736D
MSDLLVVGDANPDLVLRGDVVPRWGQAEQLLDAAELVLGGSAAITATGAAHLGVRVKLLAAVGDDLYGTFVREALTARGVDTSGLRVVAEPTGLSVILSTHDRTILTLPGAIGALRASDVDLAGVRHLHVASYFLQPRLAAELPDLFARARSLGITTSLDTNWDPAGRWDGVRDVLAYTDVFLPNEVELTAITGIEDARAAATALGTTVVLKAGAAGAQAWWPGGSCSAPGLAVEVVDTTGAGDSFNAGFLAGFLAGQPIERCVAMAATAGSLSTRAAGGTAAQPTLATLLAIVDHELPVGGGEGEPA